VPRRSRSSSAQSIRLFGHELPSPFLIAPIGVQGIAHPDGEEAVARAAADLQVPFILSTASTRSIEQVAEASGDNLRWYQLYWPASDDVTLSLLKRAKDNGFKALVVTLDTFTLGFRCALTSPWLGSPR
jgi:isopentenyl diphosphate isomerase/L-lactate dehydrogenase-like FMN-dependent dehydrogenase